MAIQISGSTVINNSKILERIGGSGGVVAGSVTVPFYNSKLVRLSGVRGIAFGFATGDYNTSTDGTGCHRSSIFHLISSSTSTGNRYRSVTLSSSGNQALIINEQIDQGAQLFGFNLINAYGSGSGNIFYYYFIYSGDAVPTISIT